MYSVIHFENMLIKLASGPKNVHKYGLMHTHTDIIGFDFEGIDISNTINYYY